MKVLAASWKVLAMTRPRPRIEDSRFVPAPASRGCVRRPDEILDLEVREDIDKEPG
jgi:hypothetical protein